MVEHGLSGEKGQTTGILRTNQKRLGTENPSTGSAKCTKLGPLQYGGLWFVTESPISHLRIYRTAVQENE